MLFRTKERRIYLDHASATPVHREVLRAMEPYFGMQFGNVHKFTWCTIRFGGIEDDFSFKVGHLFYGGCQFFYGEVFDRRAG